MARWRLCLAACAMMTGFGAMAADETRLAGSSWTAEQVDGRPATGALKPQITFEASGRAYGSTGCNRMSGGFEAEGGRIAFSKLATTRMACAPEAMDQEARVLKALGAATRYEERDGRLWLLAADGRAVLVLAPQDGD